MTASNQTALPLQTDKDSRTMATAPAAAPDPAAAPLPAATPAVTPAAAPPDPAPQQPLGPGQDDVEGFLEGETESPEHEWDKSSADPSSPAYKAAEPAPGDPAATAAQAAPAAATLPPGGQPSPGAAPQPAANPAASAPPGYVPLQALDESRAETKQLKETVARLDGNFQTFVQMARQQQGTPGAAPQPGAPAAPGQPAPAAAPDRESDPVAYLEHKIEQLTARLPDPQQQKQVADHHANIQQFQDTIAAKEAEFEATHPDYGQALAFLRDARASHVKSFGATAAQARTKVLQDEMQAAAHALSQGIDPVAKVYEVAQLMGYRPGVTNTPPANGGQPGAAAPGALSQVTPPGAVVPGNATLAAVADGLAHGQTPGNGNAAGATQITTGEQLSAMQDQLGPDDPRFVAAWNRLMSGGNASLTDF